ncbi:MAG: glycosyltransferase family 9 protein [bacterium]|nr:glycosyltransferase family 9 protein [bacterium]
MATSLSTLDSGAAIAALLFRRVGDSLLATPAIRALKERYPKSRTFVLCEPQVIRVFEGLAYVDEIVNVGNSPSSLMLANALRAIPNLGASVDFLSDPRSALACAMGGAAIRVGFAKSLRRIMYTHRVAVQASASPVYSAIHKLKLAEALGANSSNWMPDFALKSENEVFAETQLRERNLTLSGTIAFFVTSRREYKRWPLERFAEVTDFIQSFDKKSIAVIGGENERGSIEEFCSLANLSVNNVSVFTNIGEMAGFLSHCELFVGNDGGPKHLAVAVGTPTVTIFQNDPWEYWTPPNSSLHIAVGGEGQSPSAEEVIRAVKGFISH